MLNSSQEREECKRKKNTHTQKLAKITLGWVAGVNFLYVCDLLHNSLKVHMPSFRKNIQSFSKNDGKYNRETDKQTN